MLGPIDFFALDPLGQPMPRLISGADAPPSELASARFLQFAALLL